MKLFIIDNVLNDYTSGMVAIKAESLAQAREFFLDRFDNEGDPANQQDFDEAIKTKDFIAMDLADTDQSATGIVKVMFGGG